MKIEIQVSGNFCGNIRGGEKHALEVGKRLRERGHDVSFLSWGTPDSNQIFLDIEGFRVDYLCSKSRLPSVLRLRRIENILTNSYKIRRFDNKPDVILSFSPWFALASYIANKRIPIVYIVADLLVASKTIQKGRKFVFGRSLWFRGGFDSILECLAYKCSSFSLVSSRWMAEGLKLSGLGANSVYFAYPGSCIQENAQMNNSVNIRAFFGIPEEGFLILYAGALTYRKQPMLLAEAIKDISKDIYLIYAGSGPCEEEIIEYSKTYGLTDRIKFAGWVKNIEDYYSACDALCHTATYETFGLIYQEALMFNKLIIGPKHIPPFSYSAAPELITEGVNGFLYDPQNIKDLCFVLEKTKKQKNISDTKLKVNVWDEYMDVLYDLICQAIDKK